MNHRTDREYGRRLLSAIISIGMLLAGAIPLAAQGWQKTFGVVAATPAYGFSAIELSNGDIVTVGRDNGFMVILRTDGQGTFISEESYAPTNYSSTIATDVAEIPGSNGDIVVIGEALENTGLMRGFVMRMGTTNWVRIFKSAIHSIYPAAVTVAKNGGPNTAPGDIIFCGRWTANEGIMARVDGSNGNPRWFKSYDVNYNVASTGQLSALDEAQIGPGAGDIVATGHIFSHDGSSDAPSDLWVLRVNGDNGSTAGPGLGSAVYSTPDFEYGVSIQELRFGPNNGDLVIAGSREEPGIGGVLLLLQTAPDPCILKSDYTVWTLASTTNPGQGIVPTSICEIPPGVGGTTGNLVVTGARNNGPFGMNDVFTQEIEPGTLEPIGFMRYYGGTGNDLIRSINPVINAPTSNGFILAGNTLSANLMPPGHTQNIYLLRIFSHLGNNCEVRRERPVKFPGGTELSCVPTTENSVYTSDAPTMHGMFLVQNGLHLCPADMKRVIPGEEGSGTDADISAVEAFPSPVGRGTSFTLNYSLTAPATVTVTVADMAGRIIHRAAGERSEGRITETIPTGGWNTGTYLVTVNTGARATTSRIIVNDR